MTGGEAPLLPPDIDEPAFTEPWHAEAFALTVALHQAGAFSWSDWAAALSQEIRLHPAGPDEDPGRAYWRQWLAALDRLAASAGLVEPEALAERIEAWRRAYLTTPHGAPVVLPR